MSRAARRPWPPRRYGWVAHYVDGSRLHEVYDAPPLTPFEAVEKHRLARFSLVDLWPGGEGEIISLDCESGVVHARGRRLEFALGPLPISGRDGRYSDVVQYKEAHVEWRPGRGSSGTVVDAHAIGYERDLPELRARVIVRLHVPSRRIGIDARVRPKRDLGIAPSDFRVLVDGEPVTSEAEFASALAPKARPSRREAAARTHEVGAG